MLDKPTVNVAVFASGSGTNAENIIRYFADGHSPVRVAVVVCNKPRARVIDRATALGVPVEIMPKADINDRVKMTGVMDRYAIDFIALAGFMLMIPDFLLERYPRGIVNIHPSLLPKFGGKGMYGHHVHEAVHAAGEAETGITVHLASPVCDCGEIIFQAKVRLTPDDSPADIEAKVHALEYEHFPHVIEEAALGCARR